MEKKTETTFASVCRTENERIKATEKRLYKIPILIARVNYNTAELSELEVLPPHLYKTASGSIMKAVHAKQRYNAEISHDAHIALIKTRIKRDKRELARLRHALFTVYSDRYFFVIEQRYFRGIKDSRIAVEKSCGTSTLRRHRLRLLRKVAAFLYPDEA